MLGSRKDARKMHGVFWIVGWHPTIMDRGLNKYKLVSFNHTDIHKKARHEISLMSGKIEICVRRLEDYHALRHNTMYINDIAFYFIYNHHLLAERDGSHNFSILDR